MPTRYLRWMESGVKPSYYFTFFPVGGFPSFRAEPARLSTGLDRKDQTGEFPGVLTWCCPARWEAIGPKMK